MLSTKVSFSIILLLATFKMYTSQQCSYDTNVDYFGNDLIPAPAFFNNSDGCCLYCSQNSQCQVWTWVPATRACWIKTSVGARRFSSVGSKISLIFRVNLRP